MRPGWLWMFKCECFEELLTFLPDPGVTAVRSMNPASLTHYVKRALWNFADVTLADDDNNSMLTEGDSKAFWGIDGHKDGDRATGWRGDRFTSRARSLARWCRSFMERWRWCMLERVGKTFLRISSVRGVLAHRCTIFLCHLDLEI